MATAQRPSHERVLAAAERLLANEGPGGLSVRRLAEVLGVSRQIVYSRFVDKPGLVRALHAEGFRRLTERMRAVPGGLPPDERVLALAHAYRAAALASPVLYELMFGRPIVGFEPDDAARAVAEAAFAPVVDAASACLAWRGGPSSRRATLRLARAFWATTHGAVALELAGHLREGPEILEGVLRATLAELR